MSINSEAELEGMKRAGAVVAKALAAMKAAVKPGVTPAQLNDICGEVFAEHNAVSAPYLEYGAPAHAFVSVNADVVHGLPTDRPLEPGDVVKLDVTPNVGGFVADAALTVVVPPASKIAERLVACTEAAFWAAMKAAQAGRPLYAIGRAVEREVKRRGFHVIRELAGHGVGRAIHEVPEVLNFYYPNNLTKLTEGLVLAVEPMVATKVGRINTRTDGWTIGARSGTLTAHYEHTVVITQGRPLVLTA
ncbi:MAG: Methionine aminopeptidase [uncultured Truepera sp.]|uniref:Methionine aminopeptidase n=1 Tax=uncultured Truepera sp. TaxID=543023 RepID=A0A6J4VWH2_9DEIN|nr:MAG: Methionine aminopeptidase [uncultured Truepera sp.]